MEQDKTLVSAVVAGSYDAADRPFDFVGIGKKTALICETNPAIRVKMSAVLTEMGYQITESTSVREALKNMRFHIYDMVVVNESYDVDKGDATAANEVLAYIRNMEMLTRRRIFVIMISEHFRTMDNMTAFNESVNLVINVKNIDDVTTIINQGMDDHEAFTYIMTDTMRKLGRG